MMSLLNRPSAYYVQCCHRQLVGLHCEMQTWQKITRVLTCLLTAAPGTTKITKKRRQLSGCINRHIMIMLSVPTTWRIDMVEKCTSLHPMYKYVTSVHCMHIIIFIMFIYGTFVHEILTTPLTWHILHMWVFFYHLSCGYMCDKIK